MLLCFDQHQRNQPRKLATKTRRLEEDKLVLLRVFASSWPLMLLIIQMLLKAGTRRENLELIALSSIREINCVDWPTKARSREEEKPVLLRVFVSSWPLMRLIILMPLKAGRARARGTVRRPHTAISAIPDQASIGRGAARFCRSAPRRAQDRDRTDPAAPPRRTFSGRAMRPQVQASRPARCRG
jgi:hypothetical protein